MNLTGKTFGKLTVIKKAFRKSKSVYWLCQCSCGTIKSIFQGSLCYHKTKSCGCYRNEISSKKLKIINKDRKLKIEIGQIFGRLKVLKKVSGLLDGQQSFLCLCSCGKTKILPAKRFFSGHDKSCGCLAKEIRNSGNNNRTHGMSKSPEYRIYHKMLDRCYNSMCKDYPRYGERGIKVCKHWKRSFQNFHNDIVKSIGLRPSVAYSIDRINNDGDYKPNNVKWSTKKEQANNRRSNKK